MFESFYDVTTERRPSGTPDIAERLAGVESADAVQKCSHCNKQSCLPCISEVIDHGTK